ENPSEVAALPALHPAIRQPCAIRASDCLAAQVQDSGELAPICCPAIRKLASQPPAIGPPRFLSGRWSHGIVRQFVPARGPAHSAHTWLIWLRYVPSRSLLLLSILKKVWAPEGGTPDARPSAVYWTEGRSGITTTFS